MYFETISPPGSSSFSKIGQESGHHKAGNSQVLGRVFILNTALGATFWRIPVPKFQTPSILEINLDADNLHFDPGFCYLWDQILWNPVRKAFWTEN